MSQIVTVWNESVAVVQAAISSMAGLGQEDDIRPG
jgi:hypothetical protein